MYRLLPLMGIAWVVFSAPTAIANTNLGSIREGENPEIQVNKDSLAPVVMASASTEEQKYRQMIDKDPNDVESYNRLALEFQSQGKLDKAIEIINQAIKISPEYGWSYFNLGEILAQQKKLDEAIIAYRRVIELSPDYIYGYRSLGAVLYAQSKFNEAVEVYQTAIKIDSRDIQTYQSLGKALEKLNRNDEAVVVYQKLSKLQPDNERYRYILGDLFQKKGDLEKSTTEYYEGNKLDKSTSQSIKFYEKLVRLDPKNAYSYRHIGIMFQRQNKTNEAIEAYRKALTINFAFADMRADVYVKLGDLLGSQKKFDEAIRNYYQALKADENFPGVYEKIQNSVYSLAYSDNEGGIIEEYRQELNVRPDNHIALIIIGNALYYKGLWASRAFSRTILNESISTYETALKASPRNGRIYFALAEVLAERGRLSDAIASYRQAISLYSNDTYMRSYTYHRMGFLLGRQNDLNSAIEAHYQAIKESPRYESAYAAIGDILIKQNKLDDAIKSYQKAMEFSSQPSNYTSRLQEAKRSLAIRQNPNVIVKDDRQNVPVSNNPLGKLKRSIVKVVPGGVGNIGGSEGTGWVIKRDGSTVWVVTNRHVVENAKTTSSDRTVEIELFSDLPFRLRLKASIENETPSETSSLDLAVLKITNIPDDVQPLEFQNGQVQENTKIRIIGHPFNGESWSSVSGEISSNQAGILGINATIATGNSGSPVINEQNRVIGLLKSLRGERDPNPKSTIDLTMPTASTGGFGQAYPIEVVVNQLRNWKIL